MASKARSPDPTQPSELATGPGAWNSGPTDKIRSITAAPLTLGPTVPDSRREKPARGSWEKDEDTTQLVFGIFIGE